MACLCLFYASASRDNGLMSSFIKDVKYSGVP